jgi:hypothetical protein
MLVPFLLSWVAPPVVSLLSPILDRPPELPVDARASYDWKDGNIRWQYCRNLPSGRIIVGPRGPLLEHGRRCDGPVSYTYDPPASLVRPGMRAGYDDRVTFSVPVRNGGGFQGPCPHSLDSGYLRRARSLLEEAARLSELDTTMRAALRAAAASVASFSIDRLHESGTSGSADFSTLEPPQ